MKSPRTAPKEIYAGKSLAIQAMSRSADGSGNRPVLKSDHGSGLLPGPVKALLAVAIVGGIAFAGWSVLSGPQDTPRSTTNETKAQSPSDSSQNEEVEVAVETPEDPVDDVSVAEATLPETSEIEGSIGESESVVEQEPEHEVTILSLDDGIGDLGATPTPVEPEPESEPEIEIEVLGWATSWPEHTLDEDSDLPIGKACQLIQRMDARGDRALIGFAAGPSADSFESSKYAEFRQGMYDIVTDAAKDDGTFDDLNIRGSDQASQLGTLEAHRLHVTSKSNRNNNRITILTGLQDGHSVAYWFAGPRGLYRDFLDTVGKAEFAPLN